MKLLQWNLNFLQQKRGKAGLERPAEIVGVEHGDQCYHLALAHEPLGHFIGHRASQAIAARSTGPLG